MTADTIYRLFVKCTAYKRRVDEEKKEEHKHKAVFPVIMRINQVLRKSLSVQESVE